MSEETATTLVDEASARLARVAEAIYLEHHPHVGELLWRSGSKAVQEPYFRLAVAAINAF